MIKKIRQALAGEGYTGDEIELLLKSFTELLDKLTKKARTSEDGQVAQQGRGMPRRNLAKLPELMRKG